MEITGIGFSLRGINDQNGLLLNSYNAMPFDEDPLGTNGELEHSTRSFLDLKRWFATPKGGLVLSGD